MGKEVTSDQYPPFITNLMEAFEFMNKAFHANHRTASGVPYYDFKQADQSPKEGIGGYVFPKIDDNSGTMLCDSPYPGSFEKGMLTAMVRHFHTRSEIKHLDDRDCKKNGKDSCTYLITWS